MLIVVSFGLILLYIHHTLLSVIYILNCSDCQISCNGWSVILCNLQIHFKTFFLLLLSDDIISSQHSECVYFSPNCCSRLGRAGTLFKASHYSQCFYNNVLEPEGCNILHSHFWPACVSLCDAAQYLRISRAILLALSCMSFLIGLLHVDFRWAAGVCSHP